MRVLWVSGVAFIHRPSKPGQSRVEVVAKAPGALLIAVDADGEVVIHMAADTWALADALVDQLEARDDIGEAVRTLVEASEAPA